MTTPGTYQGPAPAVLRRGVQLQVVDFNEKELTLTAPAGGPPGSASASASTDYLAAGRYWRVERIVVVSGSAATSCLLTVYRNDTPRVQRGRDWTPLPPGDVAVAEYPSFLNVYPTECLTLQVTGCNPGDTFAAAVQYQDVYKMLGTNVIT